MLRALVLLFFSSSLSQATHEAGIVIGSANHIGDVGQVAFFNVKQPSLGLLYKRNQNKRISYRAMLCYLSIKGDDKDSQISSRRQRGYSFETNLLESSIGLEFNFRNYRVYKYDAISPYIYTGLAYSFFDDFHYEKGKVSGRDTLSSSALALPLALGVKTAQLRPFILSGEIAIRYLLSDNLDGNNPDEKAFSFGKTNNNDLYVFMNITLSLFLNKQFCSICR